MRFRGKTVIVTGGQGGIGYAICLGFLAEGAYVICVDCSDSERLAPGDQYHRVDVSDGEQCEKCIASVVATRNIDVLVNCAGIQPEASAVPAHELSEEMWSRIMNVNLKGAWLMSKYCIPHMRRQRSGVIINITSVTASHSAKDIAAYAASKAGLVSLSSSMALENAAYNIRVLSLSPGSIDTPLLRETIKKQSSALTIEAGVADLAAAYPLGRIGMPEDVAHAALFAASSDASWMTGCEIRVDGGVSIQGQWAMRPA